MGKPTGFLETSREVAKKRPVDERIHDYHEVEGEISAPKLTAQAARCMDCGIPFCHQGCPLGNLIPEWNDLVYRGKFDAAVARLLATNNFPEFTGRLCPAPCEASCVLSINDQPVTIKQVEVMLAKRVEQAIIDGARRDVPPSSRPTVQSSPTEGRRPIAVIGSGPAGLACAAQLVRAGREVIVLEKADRAGGLLRYGIPDFKMDKAVLDRRLDLLRAEGVRFECGVNVGVDITGAELLERFDAIAVAVGAENARKLGVPGEDLAGVHLAMDYLTQQNRVVAGDEILENERITAEGRDVVILGGGDTGADCLGTAHRQKAKSVTQMEILPRPPDSRASSNPWPEWPLIFRVSPAHEEGGARVFGKMTIRLEPEDGGSRVARLVCADVTRGSDGRFQVVPNSESVIDADMVLVATGFTGVKENPLYAQLGLAPTTAGTPLAGDSAGRTRVPNVFVLGDARRGASLVVWAIAEGRAAAASILAYLSGRRGLPMTA